MTIENMRSWVMSAYTGDHWKAKVKRMPDSQVISLYHSLIKQGKIKGA
jgi:transposase